MIILKVSKNQSFTFSLGNSVLEKPQGEVKLTLSLFRINIFMDIMLIVMNKLQACSFAYNNSVYDWKTT